MQSASVNYLMAASGAGGTWAEPRLRADWMRDGYDVTPNMLDRFRRNLTDSWGSTDTNQTWTNPVGAASAFDVVYDGTDTTIGGYGSHTITEPTGSYFTRHSVLSGPLVFVTTQTVKLSLPVPTGDAIEAGMMFFRYTDASNHYRAGAVVDVGGGVRLAVVRAVTAGETVLIDTSSGVTYAGGSDILVVMGRMLADGTIQLKAWIDGTAPPATWTVEITDAEQITDSGVPGLRTVVYPANNNARPVIVKYHEYRVDNGLPDDISGQLGRWNVQHHFDDGYPDSVTFISGVGVADLTAELTAPPSYLTDGRPVEVAEFYSPYSTTSPIYGRDRDVAPVTLDHGVITSDGPERVTVFTGQMLDIPVRRGRATLLATSANRLKLAKPVWPQAFWRYGPGLNGTWPVSFAMAECGVYVSPPPRDGCRFWAPMHGSTRPFIPNLNALPVATDDAQTGVPIYSSIKVLADGTLTQEESFDWVTGPYLLAGDLQLLTAESRRHTIANIEFGDGADFLSTAGNKGRAEFWIRGDATNVNSAPGGSGTVSRLCGFQLSASAGARFAFLGVNTSRRVEVRVIDGAGNTGTLTSDDTLPTDGGWYFVGAAYDLTTERLWVTNFSGTTKSSTVSAFVTSSLPSADIWTYSYPNFISYLPCAEVHLTSGAQANVDTYPTWLNSIAFTPSARIHRSNLELVAMVEKEPVEAWEFISGFAQSELASMRTDELDVVNYLTPGWWVQDEQQVIVDLISTEINTGTVDINVDPTKIRNSVRVSFQSVEVSFGQVTAYSLAQQLTIPPGATTVRFALSEAITAPYGLAPVVGDDIDATAYDESGAFDYATLNSETDGSGTYATSTEVTITRTAWDAGSETWEFQNNSSVTWYTANGANKPTLRIAATVANFNEDFGTDSDPTSVAQRGERLLPVTAPATQTLYDARMLAGLLKMGLRNPLPVVEGLTLFGEARRQPGDLVQFEDPSITKVSGRWRVQSITHRYEVDGDSVSYTQPAIVRPTVDIGVWGSSTWGDCLWGPASE